MTTPKKMSEDKRPCLDPICARPLLMQKIAAQAEEIEALKAEVGPLQQIAAERQRQKDVEGWSLEHDDRHDSGEMALAAACYAAGRNIYTFELRVYGRNYDPRPHFEDAWPWAMEWWKPKDRRSDLVRAAALIVAEIERLDRRALKGDVK